MREKRERGKVRETKSEFEFWHLANASEEIFSPVMMRNGKTREGERNKGGAAQDEGLGREIESVRKRDNRKQRHIYPPPSSTPFPSSDCQQPAIFRDVRRNGVQQQAVFDSRIQTESNIKPTLSHCSFNI